MADLVELDAALRRFHRLLFDTCVLITEFKKSTGRLGLISPQQRATSSVAVWEFLHGTKGAWLPATEREARHEWLREQNILRLPLSRQGSLRFDDLLMIEGPTSVPDALLAAECLALDIPIVTSNVRDFQSVDGRLYYVDW